MNNMELMYLRTVIAMNEDVRVFGYCAECGSEVTDEDVAYVDSEGRYFDNIECVCEYYNISKVEF